MKFRAATFGKLRSNERLAERTFKQILDCSPRLAGNGYSELLISSDHAIAIDYRLRYQKDPFDRHPGCKAMWKA